MGLATVYNWIGCVCCTNNRFGAMDTNRFGATDTRRDWKWNYRLLFVWFLWLQQQMKWASAEVPNGCDELMDLVFVMDSSESMIEYDPWGKPYYHYNMLKDFTKNIVQDLPLSYDKTRVAFVQYATQPKTVFRLDRYYNVIQMQHAIDNDVKHEGGITYTSQALRHTREVVLQPNVGERSNARDVVVVITDGLSNYDYENTVPMADELRRLRPNAEVFTVAVTKYVDESELKGIASKPAEEHYLQMLDYNLMDYYVSLMVHRLCRLPDPTPPAPTPPQCEVKTDLTLLIDNSGSIRDKNKPNQDNYKLLLSFLVSLIDTLNVGPDTTRVAAVRFSRSVYKEFYLDDYTTKEEVRDAINRIPYEGSYTYTAEAIKVARDEIFDVNRGDRPDVRNVIILITDGESTIEPERTLPEAQQARDENIIIFVVGVTDEINEAELKGIASTPIQNHYFNSTSIANLDSIFNQLLRHVCARDDNPVSSRKKRSSDCNNEDTCFEDEPSSQEIDLHTFFVDDDLSKTEQGQKKNGSHQFQPLQLLWLCCFILMMMS